jgi:hypothetical protein
VKAGAGLASHSRDMDDVAHAVALGESAAAGDDRRTRGHRPVRADAFGQFLGDDVT